MDALHLLESMSALSGRMVEAARANDWEGLVALEREFAALRERARTLETPVSDRAPTEAQRRHRAQLIDRMLADDREIRAHVEPWMASARQLFAEHRLGRTMRAAYDAMR